MGAVTIIGTGNMARSLGHRLSTAGTAVTYAGRDHAAATRLAAETGGTAVGLDEPVTTDVVILATPYPAAREVAHAMRDRLDDHIVVDITNPLNETYTALTTPPGTSAAELIASELPVSAHLVKAFNTTFAGTLIDDTPSGEPLDVLLAGDDEPAKLAVAQLATSAGLHPVDLGPLANARHLESAGFLHILAQQTLGTHFQSSLKILANGQ